jgi:mono/diheme cytochrome c family protein
MRRLLFVIFILGALVSAACGNRQPEAISTLGPIPTEYAGLTNPLGAEAAADGAEVFHVNCEPCHGAQGHGDGPAGQILDPKPKNLGQFQKIAGDDILFWKITTGSPGTAMLPWDGILTDEQIWQVIAFLRTLEP